MTKKPTLSIIIVNWNTKEILRQCLDSIITSKFSKFTTVEIIVVDNGSTDGSVEMLDQYQISRQSRGSSAKPGQNTKYRIQIIANRDNLGFAKANNQGLKIARGEYLMLLNSDTIVAPEVLEILLNYLDKQHVCAISPQLVLADGKLQSDYFMRFPNLWQIMLYHHPLVRPLLQKKPFLANLVMQTGSNQPFQVDQLPGAALIASKSTWHKIGELDENFHFFFEDVDWSWRASKNGVNRLIVPKAIVTHLGGASWRDKLTKDKNQLYHQYFSSYLLFVKKNYPLWVYPVYKIAVLLNFLCTGKLRLLVTFVCNSNQQELWR